MNFIANYKTPDNVFEVMIDMNSLSYEPERRWYGSEKMDRTHNFIDVYNTKTDRYSSKSVYISKKGLYFQSPNRGRYYIKDLIPIKAD